MRSFPSWRVLSPDLEMNVLNGVLNVILGNNQTNDSPPLGEGCRKREAQTEKSSKRLFHFFEDLNMGESLQDPQVPHWLVSYAQCTMTYPWQNPKAASSFVW
jgi:hypothetical protein